ncbi:MAG: beta-lactamase family protein [Caldilineaceae bacterium]|nr:beta-lactamase family protein [Caldilineaceae bacterium]
MKLVHPEEAGFSSQRLARLNSRMQRYIDDGQIAGIISLVARRGHLIHFEKVGMAHIDANQPMQDDTIFRIYSMTKPITSVAVLMLMEEGSIRLSDPVANYLPEFKDVRVLDPSGIDGARLVEPRRPMTIRHLLTHTAGLSYGFDENFYIDRLYGKHVWQVLEEEPDTTLAQWIGEIANLPLAYHPGEHFRYSVATDVLGYLVQVVSGQPFAQFLQQRIFDPLGMEDTFFTVPTDKLDRFAANYGHDENGSLTVIDEPRESQFAKSTVRPSGGGGLLSTTGDYLRFAQMLLNQGALDGERLLGRKSVELMRANHLPDGVFVDNDPSTGLGFGLGVSVQLALGKLQTLGSQGNYGWGGAANTNFWIDPQEELLGILMLQYMPSGTYPVTTDFRNLVYQALVD